MNVIVAVIVGFVLGVCASVIGIVIDNSMRRKGDKYGKR